MWITSEDDADEFDRRQLLIAACDEMDWASPDMLQDNLHFIYAGRENQYPLWGVQAGKHGDIVGSVLPGGRALELAIRNFKPVLVVVDNAAAAFGGNENDRATVRRFTRWLSSCAMIGATKKNPDGPAIALIAHPPKGGHAEYSGSTDWEAGVRHLYSFGLVDATERTSSGKVSRLVIPKEEGERGKPPTAKAMRIGLGKTNRADDRMAPTWTRIHRVYETLEGMDHNRPWEPVDGRWPKLEELCVESCRMEDSALQQSQRLGLPDPERP